MASDVERDIFEGSMEPELMCVGLSSDFLDRQESEDIKVSPMLEKQNSIIARRKAGIRRGMIPLTIPIENAPDEDDPEEISFSFSATTDSGLSDVELSENSLESESFGLRRQLDSTSSVEEEVFENDDPEHPTGSLPITIPNPVPSPHTHKSYGTPGLRGSFPYRPMGNPWNSLFSPRMTIPGSPRSLSLTMYQLGCARNYPSTSFAVADERPRSLALVTRRASESHLLRRSVPDSSAQRPPRLRSLSGSKIPSPSRSIGTQTPTGETHFVFPDPFDTGNDYVMDVRLTATVTDTKNLPERYSTVSSFYEIEGVGQQLRSIGDDFQRSGFVRNQSQSWIQLFKQGRRRSSAP